MKSTLTAIALLMAIPGMALAQDNVNPDDLPERAQEAVAADVDTGAAVAVAVDCDNETGVDEENLPERAQEGEAVDNDACETDADADAGTATVVNADADAENPAAEADLPERAQEAAE